MNYGFSLHRMGKDAEAKPFFERHLEIEPHNKKALIGLGQILLKSTKPDPKGAECWERLVALEPNNPGMLNNLATTLKNLGRMPEAEDACRRALGIKPGYFPALCNLGLVLSSEARFDEARQTLREAIHQVELEGGELRSESYPELSKEQLIEFLSVTYNQLAAVTNVLGNEDEAQWAVDQGFRLVPDHSDHHMMQAFLYLQRGEFEKGWPHYEYRKENSLGPRSFSKPNGMGPSPETRRC